jgi:DMSO/TMAO reductase YedYZ molybdopterin-dependent catalytic subunit
MERKSSEMESSDSRNKEDDTRSDMHRHVLPPGQRSIETILGWNIDHPGIKSQNPNISRDEWKLTVSGEIEKPVKFSWTDFMKLPAEESISDFHCVEGWSVLNCHWYGVKFRTLCDFVQTKENAKSVFFRCYDDYTTSLDLGDLLQDDVILAYKLYGEDLPVPLGGPLRLVVPKKYAYKSALWVKEIEFMKDKKLGFWENRGYSDTADVWKNDRYSRFRW